MRNAAVSLLCFGLAVFLMVGCSKSGESSTQNTRAEYKAATKLNVEFADLMGEYLAEMEKAEAAPDLALAMNSFAEKLAPLWPQIQALSVKFSELGEGENLPEPLLESQKAVKAMNEKVGNSFSKVMPHIADPEVAKAHERLMSIIMSKAPDVMPGS